MDRNIKLIIGLVVVLLIIFSIIYFTDNSSENEDMQKGEVRNTGKGQLPPGGMDRPARKNTGFPIEAIEACENLEEGSECSAEIPEGEETGICTLIEEDLVCQFDRPTMPQ